MRRWQHHDYPAIEKRARKEGAEVHRLNETAIVNTEVRGRTPVAYAPGSRSKLSMISTVTS